MSRIAVLNALVIVLVVIGLFGLYGEVAKLNHLQIVQKLAEIASKYSLWVGLGLKLLDWIISQKDKLFKRVDSLSEAVSQNRISLTNLEGDANRSKERVDDLDIRFIRFDAEYGLQGNVRQLQQQFDELSQQVNELVSRPGDQNHD